MRRVVAVAASGLLLVALGACTDETTDPGPGQPSTAGSVAPSADSAPVVTRRVDAAGDILAMSVGPLVRSGGAVVLTVMMMLKLGNNSRMTMVDLPMNWVYGICLAGFAMMTVRAALRMQEVLPAMLIASTGMLLVGLAACGAPALRALRIQATEAMRYGG